MKKLLLCVLAAGLLTPALAQEKFEQGKPGEADYRYLDEYKALKEYINTEKYPNFKLGSGTTVPDYLSNATFKGMIDKNFSETVAGNAMKMGSIVNGNGDMNFETVKKYVKSATDAGLSVYGHTLAWHSQQPKAWLLKLIGDKPDPTSEETYSTVASKDFTKDKTLGWKSEEATYGYSLKFDANDGLHVNCTKMATNFWDVQFIVMENIPAIVGKTYKMTMTVKGSTEGKFHSKMASDLNDPWNTDYCLEIPFTTEWKDVEVEYKPSYTNNFLLLQCGDFVGDIYVKSIKFEGNSAKMIPQTKQEMHDALVDAMDQWIKGMMEACDGKVKGWDLVNEAISGGGDDGEGNYVLQHSTAYNPNGNPDATWDVGGDNFYWQDYMGDIDYVRVACKLARQYGPKDIKLFINDYNLESDWDDNKKLKSLINWIKKWEADGVTKIDGIGTQMHISYHEDSSILNSRKQHITKMFELLANSGKLVRVSEMDMGYVISGTYPNEKKAYNNTITEAQHKKMAELYEWIIKEYFRIIPPAQQWGICQWCPTDAPDVQNMWRRAEPVGIFDLDFYRKHVYAGFVRGLNGGEPTSTGMGKIATEKTLDAQKGIYTINGVRLPAKSLDELPKGLYIVDGKKVAIK